MREPPMLPMLEAQNALAELEQLELLITIRAMSCLPLRAGAFPTKPYYEAGMLEACP